MEQSATFLINTILITIGCVVITAGIVCINNLFVRFWKPMNVTWFTKWFTFPNGDSVRYMTPEEEKEYFNLSKPDEAVSKTRKKV